MLRNVNKIIGFPKGAHRLQVLVASVPGEFFLPRLADKKTNLAPDASLSLKYNTELFPCQANHKIHQKKTRSD